MALIMLVFIIGLAATAFILNALNANTVKIERDKKTAEALAVAKAALIDYAIGRDDDSGTATIERPGEFPCPDTTNDGYAESSCVSGRLGRLPWKTLNIDRLLDGSGEALWYTLSGPFRNKNSNPSPINSDTHANISVFGNDGVSLITSQAVALVFAPGALVGTQHRDTASAPCLTTGTSISANLCATNYLEGTAGISNAVTNGPFIDGTQSATYNDRIIYILGSDFIPDIEKRVGGLLKTLLANYFSANGVYPWPDNFSTSDGVSDIGLSRGRLPLTAAPVDWSGSYLLPSWFMNNQWYNQIYYATGVLTADGVAAQAVFFMPGAPVGAIVRPSNNLSDYLEDPENKDGVNDVYITPTSQNRDRDRIYVLP